MLSILYSLHLTRCHGPKSFKLQPFHFFDISSQGQKGKFYQGEYLDELPFVLA